MRDHSKQTGLLRGCLRPGVFFVCAVCLILFAVPVHAEENPYRTETVTDPLEVPARVIKNATIYNADLTTRKIIDGKKATLIPETEVSVVGEKTADGKKWMKISFFSGEKKYTGYTRNTRIVLQLTQGNNAKIIGLTSPKKIRATADNPTALKINGKKVTVASGNAVTLLEETAVGTAKWYKITFTFNKNTVTGYIKPRYVQLAKNKHQVKIYAQSSEEFEGAMTEQGIPEIYKPYLRTLHELYPFWEFRAYKTGLNWNTALKQECKIGRSLISNSKSEAWKSKDPEAYNAETGKWKVFDGSVWVAASTEAVAYYMDPRNFLNERTIYQFELQEYQKDYQKASAVDKVFANTPFAGNRFSYVDPLTGKDAKMTYTDAYINAARETNVSPIHLASRTKQEVVTSATTTSGAVTGTNKNYPGIYNFYNIGAYSGKNPMENGLKWASTGDTYMRPWTDPYRSIVGGAMYIGSGYISKGQNTVYLEKFNMTENDRYEHQYMTNVEAACAEAIKIQKAYSEAGLLDQTPLVFSIPVYENMPEEPCAAPV